MKKINLVCVFLLVLILSACKPAATSLPTAASQDTVSKQVEQIQATVAEIPQVPAVQQVANVTSQVVQGASQTILVPVQQPASDTSISMNYVAPCLLRNWKVLNIYCNVKTFWHNMATLMSWYIHYTIVLFLLIASLIIIWWLTRKKG